MGRRPRAGSGASDEGEHVLPRVLGSLGELPVRAIQGSSAPAVGTELVGTPGAREPSSKAALSSAPIHTRRRPPGARGVGSRRFAHVVVGDRGHAALGDAKREPLVEAAQSAAVGALEHEVMAGERGAPDTRHRRQRVELDAQTRMRG